ncbi:hypothetical protein HHL22_21380 [Hymenobacter sp. RP-2-7]|uniref:DUF7847 domain-containing protein n=1 Tax=Hymenobacter polaris TaxID=2682546 RepID=A0A7Y0AI64_9BACT|nr:hypothetical protein [Hymenobacter polaris]NML67762.1 hypothetical protein [Hymenobacter polaris]
MKNTFTTPADFWQERDFGAKISAAFEFIGAHWRPLGKCLVYFVLPGALLMGIGLGLMTNTMWNRMGDVMQHKQWTAQSGSGSSLGTAFNFQGMGLAFMGGLLGMLLVVSTVYGYLRARLRLPATEPVTPAAVWAELRARLGSMLLALLLLGGLYLLVVFGFVAGIGLLGVGGEPSAGKVGMVMLLFVVLGILLAYAGVALGLYFPVLWLEDTDAAAALGRCFQLVRGKWWSTFGLLLVSGLIQSTMSIVFAMPQYAVMGGKMLQLPGLGSDVLGLVAQTFYSVGLLFTYCIPLLALAFQYFNLVERREGFGLRLLVDELGQPAIAARSQHYQPDEEGEY